MLRGNPMVASKSQERQCVVLHRRSGPSSATSMLEADRSGKMIAIHFSQNLCGPGSEGPNYYYYAVVGLTDR